MDEIDLNFLSRQYEKPLRTAELVVGGVNRTYRLSDGPRRYYLRMYRPEGRSMEEIAFELRLLRRFRPDRGINVARPIATSNGTYLVRLMFQGAERHACLFEALEGRPLTYSAGDMTLFGAALAKLHGALSGIEGEEARPLDMVALCCECIEALKPIAGSQPIMNSINEHCIRSVRHAFLLGLPTGNCHGDAWPANAVAQDGGVGFFDFDDCGSGPYAIDLGTAAWHLSVQEGEKTTATVTALVSGYEAVRPLELAERQALPHFIRLAQVRSLLFLAKFCTLDEELWQDAFGRAQRIFERPSHA